MKKIMNEAIIKFLIIAIVLTVIMVTSPLVAISNDSQIEYDFSGTNPDFSLEESLPDGFLDDISDLDPRSSISRDLRTGELSYEAFQPSFEALNEIVKTEPFTPGEESLIDPFRIIGQDERTQITNVNAYPWSKHAFLMITYANGVTEWGGTAFFVNERTLMTAGHLLFHQRHGWASAVWVVPGGPFSNFSTHQAASIVTTQPWVSQNNWDFDYGLIRLSSNVGNQTGWYGLWAASDAQLRDQRVDVIGFPVDRGNGTMWRGNGFINRIGPRRIGFTASATPGMSGGPVVNPNEWRWAVGMFFASGATNAYNQGIRITQEVFYFYLNNR